MSTVTLATVSPPSPQPAWSGEVTCDGYRLVMGHDDMLAFFCDWLHAEPAPGEPRRIAVDTETGSASDGGRWEVRCVTMARGDLAVVLDPAVLREVLLELLLSTRDRQALSTEDDGAGTGGALVDG